MAATEFGTTLRRHRDRIDPHTVGLRPDGRRRAAGLRREEVAELAGISVDYLTRLEQGRATNPSPQVVDALCRALRMSPPERRRLFHAAGLVPPGRGSIPTYITPSVQRLLDRLSGTPVAVSDAAWTVLVANAPYTALMGQWHGRERNAAWRNFLGSGGRVRYSPQARHTLDLVQVTDLRATARKYPADRRLAALIAELRTKSPRFARLWDSGESCHDIPTAKTVIHPTVGEVNLDCDILAVASSDQRIVVYTAEPGSRDAQRLELISVVGTQTLTG